MGKVQSKIVSVLVDCLEKPEPSRLERTKAFVDGSSLPIVVTNSADGTVVHCNEAWCGMCGYARDEALGRTNGELLQGPGTDLRAARAMVGELRAGASKARAVLFNYKKDRSPFWNDLVVTHIGDDASVGVSGYDVAFLREARDAGDAADGAALSECFSMKKRLSPFTGELSRPPCSSSVDAALRRPPRRPSQTAADRRAPLDVPVVSG
ncbi:PAS domain-containing protein [Aureococcus anophagefferens]|nr:PAS domain-containing protein [Aureococcus anophagefferens]